MHERMQTKKARVMKKIRQNTVEPVLGTLINFLNMKRVNTRGLVNANKHVLMAALAYNLKKYMNHSTKIKTKAMQAGQVIDNAVITWANYYYSNLLSIFRLSTLIFS